MKKRRVERDSLGEKEIDPAVYYGIQTTRAVENFPISGLRASSAFVRATAYVKRAAARTNTGLGLLPEEIGERIAEAAGEIIDGGLRDQFVVDVFQAGAGTSHNMNMNEVIANRVIEMLGGEKGDYSICHPNDHVNLSQSTNDVFPTAMRVAALLEVDRLFAALKQLSSAFSGKGTEFEIAFKSGRTHLQDATPVTLGQEFNAWGTCIYRHEEHLSEAAEALKVLGIGGTAVGTGMNSHTSYRELVVESLSDETGLGLKASTDTFEAMQSMRPFTRLSSAMKDLSVDLIRIANDVRLLSSGPMTGIREIILPAVQPGSSIMPGKVNPVMAEMLDMVCFEVIGNDTTICLASQAGQLELNVMMPVIAYNLLFSIEILTNAIAAFSERCVEGIVSDTERCRAFVESSLALVTSLSPHIGYQKAAELAKESLDTGRTLREIVLEKGIMDREDLERILDVREMTRPGIPGKR